MSSSKNHEYDDDNEDDRFFHNRNQKLAKQSSSKRRFMSNYQSSELAMEAKRALEATLKSLHLHQQSKRDTVIIIIKYIVELYSVMPKLSTLTV